MKKCCFVYKGCLTGVCVILLICTVLASDSSRSLIHVKDIVIKGNHKTKPGIILRELGFEKGDQLVMEQIPFLLLKAKQQLLNTSLFLSASVQHTLLDSQHLYIEVTVKERWYFFPAPLVSLADKNFNLWWSDQNRDLSRVNAGVALEYKNMTGNNDRLAFGVQFGYSQILGMSYHRPNIGKLRQHGLGGRISYVRNREVNYGSMYDRRSFVRKEEFIRTYLEARVYYTFRRKVNIQHYFSLALFHENIADTVAQVNPEYLGSGLRSVTYPEFTYRFQYQKLNSIQYPLYGQMFQAELSRSLGINHHINITQLRLEAGYFRKIFPRTYISVFAMTRFYLPIKQPFIRSRGLGYSSKEIIRTGWKCFYCIPV
jgi:outer membrane protein assembly factor BamA